MNPIQPHHSLEELWKKLYPNSNQQDVVNQFLGQALILDQVEEGGIRSYIFGYGDLKVYHINKSAAQFLGSSPEHIMREGLTYVRNCFEPKQKSVPVGNAKLIIEQLGKLDNLSLRNTNNSYVNWWINHPDGTQHRSLLHSFPVLMDENGKPFLGMTLIHDLEPFLVKETWWCRYKFGDKIFIHHSANQELIETDILTNRELEILKMIYKGASSKEIAEALFLSVHTVDNHRRNMLKRTGAKDTSALIHVCKLCRIL